MTTLSPIGHPSLRLNDIHPCKSPAFSPNLHRWMRSRGHAYQNGGVADTVYRVRPDSKLATTYGAGTLFIGHPYSQYEGDTDFSGELLIAVLCHGTKAGSFCFAGAAPALEEVTGFWDRYLDVGRCAIDPDHKEHFIGGDRFRIEGDLRECLWCGARHRIETQTVMVPKTVTTYTPI
ncbi:hypothetical protein [Chromobacterium haemolyticum]|uniref:hypothetical protein n=1 Tax=Chromobacterium haemolyticum TaxID=394935 RepID=UPI0024484E3B|nr:hypothetical protein [Chromobacterium haemolyticum]MDH0342019.1 hypothetical protein [Chromobacterium haemolyticum]